MSAEDGRAPLSADERERYERSVSTALDMFATHTDLCDDAPDPCIAHDARERFRALLAEHAALKTELAAMTARASHLPGLTATLDEYVHCAGMVRAHLVMHDAERALKSKTGRHKDGPLVAGIREALRHLPDVTAGLAALHAVAAQQQAAPSERSAPAAVEPNAYRAKVTALVQAARDCRDAVPGAEPWDSLCDAVEALDGEHPADKESSHG